MAEVDRALQDQLFANFQYEIYGLGVAGERPKLPLAPSQLEERAREALSPEAFAIVGGGAGAERTMQAHVAAFEHLQIVARMLRDVAARDLSPSVLGTAMPAPLMLAPVGVQSIVHPQAELASARAAASLSLPFILSTAASHSLEEVSAAM